MSILSDDFRANPHAQTFPWSKSQIGNSTGEQHIFECTSQVLVVIAEKLKPPSSLSPALPLPPRLHSFHGLQALMRLEMWKKKSHRRNGN